MYSITITCFFICVKFDIFGKLYLLVNQLPKKRFFDIKYEHFFSTTLFGSSFPIFVSMPKFAYAFPKYERRTKTSFQSICVWSFQILNNFRTWKKKVQKALQKKSVHTLCRKIIFLVNDLPTFTIYQKYQTSRRWKSRWWWRNTLFCPIKYSTKKRLCVTCKWYLICSCRSSIKSFMHQRNQKANHSFCNNMIRVSQSFSICHLGSKYKMESKSGTKYFFIPKKSLHC